jgi:hypothetical protein
VRRRGAGLLLAAALGLLALGGCTQSSVMTRVGADELHGKPLLLLQPSLLAPTAEDLQTRVVQRIEAGLAASPEFGPITRGTELAQRDLPLEVQDAYKVLSNTLSLTGVSDPELARRLADGLHAELLAVVQPAFIPCPVCESGDELWVVGQVVDARTGRVVVRVHLTAPAPDSSLKALQALADSMSEDCLRELEDAFHLRPHRQRFTALKRLATG